MFQPGNLENVRVIVKDGRVVSSVGIYPTRVRTSHGELAVGGVSALVTHPDHRRRGLGEAVLSDAHGQMRARAMHIGLLSTRIHDYYRKFGWESAGMQNEYLLDRGNIWLLPTPDDIELRDDWRAHVQQLAELHALHPLGAHRSTDTFKLLAERRSDRIFVGVRHGKAVSYVALQGSAIREHAGTPQDAAGLIRKVFELLDDRSTPTSQREPGKRATLELSVVTPARSDGVNDLLGSLGLPVSSGYIGMIKILGISPLLDALGLSDFQE